MPTIIIANARILTLQGPEGARRGDELSSLGVIERGYVTITDGLIAAMGPGDAPPIDTSIEGGIIDAGGSVLMPAFVDCHTHACWAGDRYDEFELAVQGASYLEILRAGGGIMSTVQAVREATQEELMHGVVRRLASMAGLGTGTVEIKSGYGLNTENELKMLRAVHEIAQLVPHRVTGTFLGAHAIDPANPDFIEETINETLPAVASEFPEIVCDAYCEQGAWSLEDTLRLFEAARELGCPIRVHADQFNRLGMTRHAIELGAVSVDHLEVVGAADLEQLAESATFGVMLPCSAFHLDADYAPGRRFVDAGGALAIATNYNPGSAPTPSMPFTIALACRKLHLTAAEAITAATHNAACVLGMSAEVGSIAVGRRADVQLLDYTDERELGYELAGAGPLMVILGGEIVHTRAVGHEEVEIDEDEEESE